MSLQFIFGNSGSGKSHLLYETIIKESMAYPERNYIVIVPEQFTMQTQKDLVMMHPRKGIMNIDVLSFGRLAHRIFEEVGNDRRTVLTETGKNLMLRKVANQEKEKLQVLGGRLNRPGYVSEVKSMLSELMQYEVTDAMLQDMLELTAGKPLLHAKLTDIRTLYGAFLDYQKDRFMKPEELLDILAQVAGRSELLRKSTLAFDGFTGFTPSQMKVLEQLLVLCPQIYVTVTIDAREPFYGAIQEHELFAMSRKMIRSVTEAAHEAGILEPVILGKNNLPRYRKGGALYHLEQNLFRRKKWIWKGESEEISLHTSANPAAEVHFAARTISRLVREQGCRYRDIAVITGKLSTYENHIKKIFPMYGIQAFLDQTRHILLNPCMEFVRGALLMIEKDFSAETVFRYLRTGMAGLTPEETDRLENYVLAAGIRGYKRWNENWDYCPKSVTPEDLELCNGYRQKLMESLGEFAEKMKQKQAVLGWYADGLYELLVKEQVQQQLKDREIQLNENGAREEAGEYAQIYGILIGLLDEMVELMGEEEVTLKEFMEILDAGFSEAKVGIIPPGIDQVQVGDIERSRLNHVKVLFFLGLNDGWVPAKAENGGIVSDMERELLRENGVELAPSARENSYIQRFYLYQNLTKPSERLYLSWCSAGGDGSAMRPSYLVTTIQRLFPNLSVQKEEEIGTSIEQVTSKENGMLYLTNGFADLRKGIQHKEWLELYAMYLRDDAYSERVRTLAKAAFLKGSDSSLSYLTSKELYGECMAGSVTRLEQFAACAFAHFARYGLRLQERELYGIKPTDLGNIFHRVMELFSRRLQRCECDWSELPMKQQQEMIERCVDEVSEQYGAGMLHGSAREEYTIQRLKRIMRRTIWALHQQICAGKFRPVGFEVSFADIGELEAVHVRFGEHGQMRLKGRIDRIDTAQQDDTVYVKIIDYKTGMAKFDPVSLYYGLQLQLVVYLNAALEMEQRLHPDQKVAPAGIFYYRMQDPVMEKEAEDSDLQTQAKLLKKLRPDGVLNSDPEVLQLFDEGLEPHRVGESVVVPAGYKKNGGLRASSCVASEEQLAHLSKFVSSKLTQMGEQILEGVIDAKPFADKNGSACDYCDFQEVCGFDRKIPGMCERRGSELSEQEAWAKIVEETEENQEEMCREGNRE